MKSMNLDDNLDFHLNMTTIEIIAAKMQVEIMDK